jgi:thiosulfate dehydrogenase
MVVSRAMKTKALMGLLALSVVSCAQSPAPGASASPAAVSPTVSASPKLASWQAPDLSSVPDGPAKRGLKLAEKTYELLPKHVGNQLHCTSCHLKGGTTAKASPWVGVSRAYPEYRARVGGEESLEGRINSCFERSMNGSALDQGSDEMKALVAYMNWLSQPIPEGEIAEGRGIPKLAPPERKPDPEIGQTLYKKKCQACHGADGGGTYGKDKKYVFPAVWGDRSYNIGAGMARRDTFAAFIKHKMPLGQGESLSEQEAYDIAVYVDTQKRPDLPGKENDWPKGGAPADVPYALKSSQP